MKLKFTFLLLLSSFTFSVFGQWALRAPFPGGSRTKATAFTIGHKIYFVGGINNASASLRDVWEYDITANSWVQKSQFPGPERYGACSFVINGLGYLATGGNDNGYLDDLWQYNPATDTWLQRNGLPVQSAQHENQRREAYSFVIGNKAYLGGGDGWVFTPNNTFNYAFFDLWEYNPATNAWIQKADVPDFIGRDFSIASVIGDKAYVGLGCNVDQTVNRQGFWQYDPSTNTWTAKADFPTLFTTDASSFVVDSALYVLGGVNLNPVSASDQFYKYNPSNDTWTQLSGFTGGAIAGEFALSTGASVFAGTGYRAGFTLRNDIWEMTNTTLGVMENKFKQDHVSVVYPNPATSSATIEVLPNLKNVSFVMFDVFGNKVKELNLYEMKTTFEREDLANGIYLYHIFGSGKILDTGKIILQ